MRAFLLSGALVLRLAAPALGQGHVVDLDGRPVDPLQSPPNVRATAFIFTTTDCPIANRYAPEIRRLHDTFSRQGIQFVLVYANPSEPADAIRAHAQTFGYSMSIVRDPQHQLVKHLGTTVTPEAAIVDPQGRILYRGRIDDRYVEFGVERPTPTRREFADALTSIVAGAPITTPVTRAIGCIIADFQPVTFTRDVAPIVFDKCASCHRPGGPAPFSLLTYADVRQRGSQIAAVTRSRYMPPFRATSQAGDFIGQKRLTDSDIEVISQWVDDGTVEGDTNDLPPQPTFASGWQLGQPDLIVTTDEAFVLNADPSDVFRIFVIRLPIDRPTYVTGIEFQPGNARVVHHANIRLDRTPASRQLDAADPLPGYDGLMARSAIYPDGHFLGWTPGQIAPLVPSSMAWRLDPGTDLVVQLHMQPTGAVERVQPVIGFFFTGVAPSVTPSILRLGSQRIDIPPGEARYTITDSYLLPVDVALHAVQPHAHYRLRTARGVAILPDGSERSLIEIDDWDFRWQHVYRYTVPLKLPKGTRLSMQYTYDNSADNPRNPQQPPRHVSWGQRSFDEMGDLWFQLVVQDHRSLEVLQAQVFQKMTAEDIAGYETMLRANPADTALHDDLALLFLALGRASDAVRHFRASAALKPGDATAHFNLATALSVEGRLEEAIVEYRHALRARPNYSSAHNNLGMALAGNGQIAGALPHFREAIRLDPANVQALRNLAWYVATSTNDAASARQAVDAAERAAALTAGRDPQVLDVLAAAYAAAGLFDRAITAIERALSLTTNGPLLDDMRARARLYRQGRPYRAQ